MTDRNVVHTRHVLAVKDLAVSSGYFIDRLGFDREFTVPGWEFLSFGAFKVMLGECVDSAWAHETGDHSWFAHVMLDDVDEIYKELSERGAEVISSIQNKPWGIREFTVVTPDGHRIVYGQVIV